MAATGAVTFKLELDLVRASMLYELRERLADFSPMLNAAVSEWAVSNKDKFEASRGAEATGVSFSPEPTWEPLQSKDYVFQKRRQGFPDWLMVRTGELKTALTTEGGYFRKVDPTMAVFGSPNDPEDAIKVKGNWGMRQVLFLDSEDMKTIERMWNDYITLGPEFQSIRKAAAYAALENKRMDSEMTMIVGAA